MDLFVKSLADLDNAASEIISLAFNNRIFLFYGDMGAGKTTLIKSLCKQLGTNDNVASPTFSIVNEYVAPKGNIYHFDFYRLKTQTEAMDMGFEEYLYSGNYCFIEWPEKIPELLPENYISVNIDEQLDRTRKITLDKF